MGFSALGSLIKTFPVRERPPDARELMLKYPSTSILSESCNAPCGEHDSKSNKHH